MRAPIVNYNERSWAIDLIGHLKQVAGAQHRTVQEVGGEQTISGNGSNLFPDVLLFGDRQNAVILQGWELKMPDTSIDNHDFKSNAEAKARALGLDSYVIWNVQYAKLYAKPQGDENFTLLKEWPDLQHITRREDVLRNRDAWKKLASVILESVNQLLKDGAIEGKPFIESYRSGGITNLLLANTGHVSNTLKDASLRDDNLRASINTWWKRVSGEYETQDSCMALAQVNIINWIGKILFTHVLKAKDNRADAIWQISESTTPADALSLFQSMSETCNFWTIYKPSLGLEIISDKAWHQILQFNQLLSDLRIGEISQQQLSEILEATASIGSRKGRGQYTTPVELAKLLVRLSIKDISGKVLDPCCGSGTIARAAVELKLENCINPSDVAANVFASDIDPQAVHLATFALARPELIKQSLRLFTDNAFSLKLGQKKSFRDPTNGIAFEEELGPFESIVGNLPFIANNTGLEVYKSDFEEVNSIFENGKQFNKKADISAYLPFAFYDLLAPGGRLGLIISNSWLGTDWGSTFKARLQEYFNIRAVVISGAGRWFQNSKVVANILILEKPVSAERLGTTPTKFVVLKQPLSELTTSESINDTVSQIELGTAHGDSMNIRTVSQEALDRFRAFGLDGTAQFIDVDWVSDLPLCKVDRLFEITRGVRTGKDKMFYPKRDHGIEEEYLKPMLESFKYVQCYTTCSEGKAFCCSRSIQELEDLKHNGALSWIRQFANGNDKRANLSIQSLAKKEHYWYAFKGTAMGDLAISINYGRRLAVPRVQPSLIINQRLTRLTSRAETDIELAHALLNCTISLFIIEGLGFGRGQGALDLNKDRVEGFMHMLDPSKVSVESALLIKEAFVPIKNRKILDIPVELEQADRQKLDDVILSAFELNIPKARIYQSLLELVSIRLTAND